MFYTVALIPILIKSLESKSLRIIGGRDAVKGELPYVVRLELLINLTGKVISTPIRNQHMCTGAVLTPIWTLTAAHCLEMGDMDNGGHVRGVVRYGSVFSAPGDIDSFSNILSYVNYPYYRAIGAPFFSMSNDVALLRTTPIKIKSYGRLSVIDYGSLWGSEVTLVGFGLMPQNTSNMPMDTLELKKPLQVLKSVVKKCPAFATEMIYPVVCLAGRCGEKVAMCPGDSGGPVLHRSRIIGVTSAGAKKDCTAADPSLYSGLVGIITPTSSYVEWITRTITECS